ncbi:MULTISPECIES: phage major capsid protein [Lysinibacillus]|uniref:phage major capsid protein n=1 Tax=Lysinibacillus TaxID=400634 RepID=UPI00214B1CCF|nr:MULTISPECIES: phage major capsid protein [Lysinibacillus]UUV23845.1 phage major capsid protein [Lysinibacillus sp. FN11]UYB46717.1 phage major capsid protein [Lysinibacillus capsici]
MDKIKEMLKKRSELLNKAKQLVAEGKIEDFNAVEKEIETLDAQIEAAKLANANLKALEDKQVIADLENYSKTPESPKVIAKKEEQIVLTDKQTYENAWAKHMMGQSLTNDEQVVFENVNKEFSNAYTHDTGNTAILIPETVVGGIWSRAEEMYPLFGDAKKYNVQGKMVIKKHSSIDAGDAAWYTESTPTADEQNTFGELVLDGHELSKAITITWKLRAMAIPEFISYIKNELAQRIGVALGYAAARGNGNTEPQGVETALLAEVDTPQVVAYSPDASTPIPLSYAIMTKAVSKLHSSYLNGASIYANNATIWNELANLMDDNGRPLFIPDVTSGGVGRMFGLVVKPDASITDGSIIIGNAQSGYVVNTNEPMSIATEEHVKARTVDYAAYTIVDGGVLDTKAFALIRKAPAA